MSSTDGTDAPPYDPSHGWFPITKDAWRLDVVTLLAVIGESSMAEHAQAITASWLCLFPRIIPAPQALLKPSRPVRMPETRAKMAGVYGGVVLDTVGFFANIIHPLGDYKPYTFHMLEVKHKDLNEAGGVIAPKSPARTDSALGKMLRRASTLTRRGRGENNGTKAGIPRAPADDHEQEDLESGVGQTTGRGVTFQVGTNDPKVGISKRRTFSEKATDILANPTLATNAARPAVPATLWSPIHILTIISFMISVAIVGTAIYWHDGNAILAVVLVSSASSLVGYASWWRPILMNRTHTNKVPKGDVMIRTREGAFVLIKCTEEVARELYSGTEECEYRVGEKLYRFLMGIGTVLLMLSVVLLGNCNWESQIFIGASYIVLNGLYWCLGMLPKSYFWDLSRYEWTVLTPEDTKRANDNVDETDQREGHRSFTRALWFAIRETKVTGWVNRSGAAPGTDEWKNWLREAEREARKGNRTWPSVARKDAMMKEGIDLAEQHAPATEIQGPPGAVQHATF